MYSNNRDTYRQAFFTTWQKHLKKMPLETVEADMVAIIMMHPEYHSLLDENNMQQQNFTVEENPFLHMSLHMAIREQIRTNRPAGIAEVYEKLMTAHENTHDVEHYMMTVLANLIWVAQETGEMPGEDEYLRRLRELM